MSYRTMLAGQVFTFQSIKEVLAKANEEKSGDVLAGVAASSAIERIAAKEVLAARRTFTGGIPRSAARRRRFMRW